MRVLVLTTTYPRWQGDCEPAFVHYLAKGLVAAGKQVTVLAPHTEGAKKQEVIDGVMVRRFQYLPQKWQKLAYDGGIVPKLKVRPALFLQIPFLFFAMLISAWNFLRKEPVDVLHAHWLIPQGVIAYGLKKISRKPIKIITTSHGADLFAFQQTLFSKLKRKVIQESDVFTVVSSAMKDYCLMHQLAEPEEVTIQSMGIDCDHVFIDAIPFEERSGFVFVGRLTEKKGCDDLLVAFALFLLHYPKERLIIVGDGLDRVSLEAKAEALGVSSSVDFVGAVTADKVAQYLNAAKFSLVPSKVAKSGDQEGLGLVVAESLSCGCITIVSDLPAIRDVHHCDALQFASGEPEGLLKAMLYAYENERQAFELSANLRKEVQEKFSWTSVCSEYDRLIDALV